MLIEGMQEKLVQASLLAEEQGRTIQGLETQLDMVSIPDVCTAAPRSHDMFNVHAGFAPEDACRCRQ